jgi:hypothetical protein
MKEQPIIHSFDGGEYRVHQLKTVEPYYSAVKSGVKTFEVRKFDRDYQIGDFLDLVHYDPKTNKLGERLSKRITYMLTDAPYVPEDYVIIGMVDDVMCV